MSFRREQGRVNKPDSITHQNQPRTPFVYSQSFMMRNDLPESEPLSEYSETPLTPLRAMPAPFHQRPSQSTRVFQAERPNHGSPYQQMTPQSTRVYQVERPSHGSPFQQMTPQVPRVYQDERPSPQSPFIARQAPAPYPQSFVTHYNPEPKFVMQSLSPSMVNNSPAKRFSLEQSRGRTSPTTALPKINGGVSTKTPPQSKFNSIDNKRFFIGSIDQVVRWHKIAKKAELYAIYEVSAILEKKYFNPLLRVYNMILRNDQKKTLPLLALFYPIDRDIPKVILGQLVTCVGRMVGSNKLQVYDMWPTTADSLIGLQRTSYLCQRTLQEIDLKTNED